MSILNALYQEETWGKGEDAVPIASMPTRHIKNVVSWIWRNRESLKMQAEAEMAFGMKPGGDAAIDAFDSAFNELLETPVNRWFGELPIIAAFRNALRKDDLIDRTEEWLTRMIGDGEENELPDDPEAYNLNIANTVPFKGLGR
jgi:hypothetical protein